MREDLVAMTETCSVCGGMVVMGRCGECGLVFVSPAQAEEPHESPTSIPLPPERPPIIFPVSEPSRIESTPRSAGVSVPPDGTRHQSGANGRMPRQQRAAIALCVLLALAIVVSLARGWSLASQDPLSEFSVISGTNTEGEQIDEWAHRQFGTSANSKVEGQIARARAALEHTMAAAIARDDRQALDWNQVASWANIAQALGLHDTEMLELAADLNVQVARYATGISKDDALRRTARARLLLKRQSMTEKVDAVLERMARKSADIDRIELALRGLESGQR